MKIYQEFILMITMIYQWLKEKKMNTKNNLDNLMLDTYKYESWYEGDSDDSTIKSEEKKLDE